MKEFEFLEEEEESFIGIVRGNLQSDYIFAFYEGRKKYQGTITIPSDLQEKITWKYEETGYGRDTVITNVQHLPDWFEAILSKVDYKKEKITRIRDIFKEKKEEAKLLDVGIPGFLKSWK